MEVGNNVNCKHGKGKYREGVEGLNRGFRGILWCTVAKVKHRNCCLGKIFEQHFGPTRQHVDGMMQLVFAVVASVREFQFMKVAKNAKDCHRQSKPKDSHKSGRNTLLRIVSDVSVHVVVSSEIVNKPLNYFAAHQDHVKCYFHTVLVFSFLMNASKDYAAT